MEDWTDSVSHCLKLNMTSSAVKSCPLLNLMPLRRIKVQVRRSSLALQLSSRYGWVTPVGSVWVRYSMTWRQGCEALTREKVAGLSTRSMRVAAVRVPPRVIPEVGASVATTGASVAGATGAGASVATGAVPQAARNSALARVSPSNVESLRKSRRVILPSRSC